MDFAALNYDEQVARFQAAAQALLARWRLADAALWPLSYTHNAVFAVESGGQRWALHIYRPGHKPPTVIQSECMWLEWLYQAGVRHIPRPVAHEGDGALLWADVLGVARLPAVLFEWVEGDFPPPEHISPSIIRSAGITLARLHQAATRFQPPAGFQRGRLDADHLFGPESPYHPGEGMRLFSADQQRVFAAVELRFREVVSGLTADRLIHGDFLLKNLPMRNDDVGVIDFDDCGWGYTLYDLAPLLLQFQTLPGGERLLAALLAGYDSVQPLPADAAVLLEAFQAARHLASCWWQAANWRHPRIREAAPAIIARRTQDLQGYLDTGRLMVAKG